MTFICGSAWLRRFMLKRVPWDGKALAPAGGDGRAFASMQEEINSRKSYSREKFILWVTYKEQKHEFEPSREGREPQSTDNTALVTKFLGGFQIRQKYLTAYSKSSASILSEIYINIEAPGSVCPATSSETCLRRNGTRSIKGTPLEKPEGHHWKYRGAPLPKGVSGTA